MKKWIKMLGTNIRGFFSHPILYLKGWVKDFKESDLIGKIKKIILTGIGIYICYELLILTVIIIVILGIFGGGGNYEAMRGHFFDTHGREPENDYELYHDYNSY